MARSKRVQGATRRYIEYREAQGGGGGSPTAQWARATRRKRGLRQLSPEQARGWGMATRKKLGLGAVPSAASPHKQRETKARDRARARATQAQRRTVRKQRQTRQAALKATGVRRARTSRASGLGGGRRGVGGRRVVRRRR